ncbi:hypothetical protein HIM_02622 [Hirsutella minnesotensis 3608]|nr:hypothetical protein HIM_02622 [Hirsutella minnesotensis 3608]
MDLTAQVQPDRLSRGWQADQDWFAAGPEATTASSSPRPSPSSSTPPASPSSPSSSLSSSLPLRPKECSPAEPTIRHVATEERSDPPGSSILRLPADILYLIGDHLDTPEALSLSLTCKAIFAARPTMCRRRDKMSPENRRRFLLMLEKDPRIGRGVFYCQSCNFLHPFQRSWGPRSEDEARSAPARPHHCGVRDRFSPAGNPYGLSYTHARLVMNEHLYGAGQGLPLGNICVRHTEKRPSTTILCTTDARIKDDELFILRTYAFTILNESVPDFRRCGGPRDFRLCEHTSFFPHSSSSPYRQHIPQLQQPWTGEQQFSPCEDAPGSCGLCLMDYEVSIAPLMPTSTWSVTIKAYHQLGACRTPEDWKWARFSEANRPHLFFPNRPNRRGSTHSAGAVKKRWHDQRARIAGQQGSDVDGLEIEGNSLPLPAAAWMWRDTKRLVPVEQN